jgi:NAD(P)H dehydrogenase (quinone)
MMHWGAIIAAPGYTNDIVYSIGGNPYGTSVTQGQDGNIVEDEENVKAAVKHQVNRTLEVAKLVKG